MDLRVITIFAQILFGIHSAHFPVFAHGVSQLNRTQFGGTA